VDGAGTGAQAGRAGLRPAQPAAPGAAGVTGMTTIESELFANQGHLRAVLDTMLDGLVITDERGIVQVFNPACERLFGWTAEEVVGRDVSMLVAPPHNGEHNKYIESYRTTGEPNVIGRAREVEAQRSDGSVFPVSISIGEAEVDGQRYFIGVIHDLTQELLLRRDATIDPLTGALNRRDFLAKGSAEITRAKRYRRACTLLMLDIDHFKNINDRYGHQAGDEALRQFTATSKEMLRENDIFGRIGGEEFAVILPETTLDGARKLAERLRRQVSELEMVTPGSSPGSEHRFAFTVSIGVAELAKSDDDIDCFLKRADQALYTAKKRGRDQVVVAAAA
jgi:two-component system cell cycle response regulator